MEMVIENQKATAIKLGVMNLEFELAGISPETVLKAMEDGVIKGRESTLCTLRAMQVRRIQRREFLLANAAALAEKREKFNSLSEAAKDNLRMNVRIAKEKDGTSGQRKKAQVRQDASHRYGIFAASIDELVEIVK